MDMSQLRFVFRFYDRAGRAVYEIEDVHDKKIGEIRLTIEGDCTISWSVAQPMGDSAQKNTE